MRNVKAVISLLAALAIATLLAKSDDQKLLEEARSLTKTFVSKLKPELLSAIENGGLVSAVSVCSEKAPLIAASLSEESGWQVSRVSSKPRNANTATPDTWERKALAQLESMKNDGVDPAALEVHELTDSSFRYLKGQTVAGVCINCHGEYITPQVKAVIERNYPHDQATGYRLGDIRGAISLVMPLGSN